jgi:hypothetical protein
MNALSRHAPLPSMLIAMPLALSSSMNFRLVRAAMVGVHDLGQAVVADRRLERFDAQVRGQRWTAETRESNGSPNPSRR